MICLSNILRAIASGVPEGDIVIKFRESPKIKPPRRNPSTKNKSNRTDYMKTYMKEYREEGKDYQKMPEKAKEMKREYLKKLKEKKALDVKSLRLTDLGNKQRFFRDDHYGQDNTTVFMSNMDDDCSFGVFHVNPVDGSLNFMRVRTPGWLFVANILNGRYKEVCREDICATESIYQ